MEDISNSGGGGDGGEEEWWKQFEEKKQKKFASKDNFPDFANPSELFHLKNQSAIFIKPTNAKKTYHYTGTHLTQLKKLIADYDIQFKNGDQYLENSNQSVDQIKKTPLGRLALARDTLMHFLFTIYTTDKIEWEMLRQSGFLQVMIWVSQGQTCNNELAKQLRDCLP